jgi:hypothetical protein
MFQTGVGHCRCLGAPAPNMRLAFFTPVAVLASLFLLQAAS